MRVSRVGKFVLVGVGLQLLSMALLFYFNDVTEVPQKSSFLLTTVVTYTLQFILSALWTWRDRKATLKQNLIRIAKFVPVKVGIWALNQKVYEIWSYLTNTFLVPMVMVFPNPIISAIWERFGFSYQIPSAFSVLTIMLFNYFIFDRIIFRKSRNIVTD